MSLMTSPVALNARHVARSLGLAKLMMRLRHSSGYEQALADAMRAATANGDIVWDVGANVGFYTSKFADWAGPAGHVYAFEPEPGTLADLREAVDSLPNVTIVPVGLSIEDARLPFARLEAYDNGAQVVAEAQADKFLEVRAGDGLDIPAPNMVKIDVEGHELEVLVGMPRLLASRDLRNIFIEVHFSTFAERGRNDTPAKIEAMLKAQGFRLRWVDQSHLHARR